MASAMAEVGLMKSEEDLRSRPANTAKAHASPTAARPPATPEADPPYEELTDADGAGVTGMGEAGGT